MPASPAISFSSLSLPQNGDLVVLMPKDAQLPSEIEKIDDDGRIARAMEVAEFSGKHLSSVLVIAPFKKIERLVLIGTGTPEDAGENEWLKVGGKIMAVLPAKAEKARNITVYAGPDGESAIDGKALAQLAMGMRLRAYKFDLHKWKTKKTAKPVKVSIASKSATAARRHWKNLEGVADGVMLARDLVNQPANFLGPVEFAKQAQKLSSLGVKVEVLDEKKMKALKMNALLGVNQGSHRPPRLAIMKWNGGKRGEKPVAFVGKGVVFDTGGISLKPPAGMEDMKGDMGGAAAVTGLMHALAARKAKANVVGIIGLVENMPDAKAQRPGDVVTSMSGQTIEIINTDAEGRLVLADALWYCQKRFKPKFMINLATLTGAILVALGKNHAGLFSNDDQLSERITKAGLDTEERVWRMPLAKVYDKMIDTPNADMKNTGGRYAGSITAGQFLQRFTNDVPWAHLDVAGTAMGSPKTEISQSWASGFGVRLLDRLVENDYE